MSFTWGELLSEVRSNLLRDTVPDEETGEYRYPDSDLLSCCRWALDTFAQHTAVATSTSYTPANGTTYTLPDNLYDPEPLEQTGFVYVSNSNGDITYLDPINYTEALNVYGSDGFYTYPDGILTLTDEYGETDVLVVRYFAYYTYPTVAGDVLGVPRWSREALAYLIAAHAISGYALKSASIRQWGAKPDTGTPEQNPLRKQQEEFFCLANKALDRIPRQDRTNWWRKSEV
jgi:hypothetical protein